MNNTLIKINKEWLSKDISQRNKVLRDIINEKYSTKYPQDMIEEFLVFWAYYEEGDESMRFEEVKGKKFHVGRRLATWFSNYKRSYKYKSNNRETKTIDFNDSWSRLDVSNIDYE